MHNRDLVKTHKVEVEIGRSGIKDKLSFIPLLFIFQTLYSFKFKEDVGVGYMVGSVLAHDKDAEINKDIRYRLSPTSKYILIILLHQNKT